VLISETARGMVGARGEGGGGCKERRNGNGDGKRQQCDGSRACGLRSNCLLLDPRLPLSSLLGRQDVPRHLYPGFVRTVAERDGTFLGSIATPPPLPLNLFPPSNSSSFLCLSQSKPVVFIPSVVLLL